MTGASGKAANLLSDTVRLPGAHPHHARQAGGSPPDSRRELATELPPHANTTPRIAFLRHLIALLDSPGTSRTGDCADHLFLGQLKTLLTGPELPVSSDVAVPRDIAYFVGFLKPKLGEDPAEFLTALVAALNDRTKLSALDPFPEWRNQPPLPLDTPWFD